MKNKHKKKYDWWSSGGSSGPRALFLPAAVSSLFPYNIYANEDETEFTTDYDFGAIAASITGLTCYVDPVAGVDTDLGGSIGAPYKSLAYALARTTSGPRYHIFRLRGGRWKFDTAPHNITRMVKYLPWDDNEPAAELTTQIPTALSWSLNTGATYQAANPNTPTSVVSGFDETQLDANGKYIALVRQTSIANVQANPGSFFYDSGTSTIYVRTLDSRVPDASVAMLLTGRCINISGTLNTVDIPVYLEKVKSFCGFPMQITNPGSFKWNVGFKECEFSYSETIRDGGYTSTNARAFVHFEFCQSWYNQKDCLNYDGILGTFAFEWGTRAGRTNTTGNAHNASTCHQNMRLVRVNCYYERTVGKPVQDVQNSVTVSINCDAGDSLGPNPDNYAYASNSFVDGTSTVMYLYFCRQFGALGRGVRNFNNSTMNIYDGSTGNLLTSTNLLEPGSVTNTLTEGDVFV
jgi:hypothetical protein